MHHIHQLYDTLTAVLHETNNNQMHFVIGADFNARVGTNSSDDDDCNTLGEYGIHNRNARGQWLKSWASIQRLTITNTFFISCLEMVRSNSVSHLAVSSTMNILDSPAAAF